MKFESLNSAEIKTEAQIFIAYVAEPFLKGSREKCIVNLIEMRIRREKKIDNANIINATKDIEDTKNRNQNYNLVYQIRSSTFHSLCV